MKNIKVKLAERSYGVQIGAGALNRLPLFLKEKCFENPIAVITDTVVYSKTGKYVKNNLKTLPNKVFYICVAPSERSKSIETFRDVVRKIIKFAPQTKPLIIALGGGVVGDLAGFVGATYRRGVPLVQIPTTLLAAVDSSIGGKTGIDLAEAKNIIGAFKQPEAVFTDIKFLKTLPPRQISSGFAEIIKYGVIKDKVLFEMLESHVGDLLTPEDMFLEKIIARCVAVKADIVAKDEFDSKDERIILNFGHTLGHAVEAASGYDGAYTHGEAVAVGMVMASYIAVELGILPCSEFERIKSLIKTVRLPLIARGVSVRKILSTYINDKKFTKGSNRFVLPRAIGHVTVVEGLPAELIEKTVKKFVR
ncbi:MAG: 3-dehydroquinate synthase [Candidatus Omnitrophica bacterium]|nr:3-dehydroquinate synthase [Candidatus Omnitrophota bacterium]